MNPVRAKIVEDPKDYKWSSYNVYAYGRKDSIVDEHSIYKELSKDEPSLLLVLHKEDFLSKIIWEVSQYCSFLHFCNHVGSKTLGGYILVLSHFKLVNLLPQGEGEEIYLK